VFAKNLPGWRAATENARKPGAEENNMKLRRAVSALVFGVLIVTIPALFSSLATAQIGIFVRIGPPALPVYDQPICPGVGYMWTPGYWAWDDDIGYYWVPGTWVEAPEPGLLWTPGWWGWNDGVYAWNAGYWGPTIGFYGGINYGFGYGGNGFYGGEWRGGQFFYNTAVVNVNTTVIRNVYVNKTVIVNNNTHVAFNGGQGGVQVQPTPEQVTYMHQQHTPPVAAQVQQAHAASQNRALFASTNHGQPAVAATARPGEFSGKGVVAARSAGGTYHAPAMSPKEARASAPPAKGAAPANHAENNRPAPANHPAPTRPAASHPAETRAANHPPAAPKPAPASHEAEPKPAAHPAPASHEAAPKPAAHPAPAPHEAAPKPAPAAHPAPKPAAHPAPVTHPAPKPAAKPAPAPHAAAPKPAPKPAAHPAPAAHAAPKPAPKPAPAPKPEEPPKEPHKG
jgi:hypothetical protein